MGEGDSNVAMSENVIHIYLSTSVHGTISDIVNVIRTSLEFRCMVTFLFFPTQII